jgi:peroxiredoxin
MCGAVVEWLRQKTHDHFSFFRHHSFGSKLGTKIVEKLYPGIVARAVILQMGGLTLRMVGL